MAMQLVARAKAIIDGLQSLAYGKWTVLKAEENVVYVNSETNEEHKKCPLLYTSIVDQFTRATPRYRRSDICNVYFSSCAQSATTGLHLNSSTVVIDLHGNVHELDLRTIVLQALLSLEEEELIEDSDLHPTTAAFLAAAKDGTLIDGTQIDVEDVLEAELLDEDLSWKTATMLSTLLRQLRERTGAPLRSSISIASPLPVEKGAVQAKVLRHAAQLAGWHVVATPSTMEALGASLALKWPFSSSGARQGDLGGMSSSLGQDGQDGGGARNKSDRGGKKSSTGGIGGSGTNSDEARQQLVFNDMMDVELHAQRVRGIGIGSDSGSDNVCAGGRSGSGTGDMGNTSGIGGMGGISGGIGDIEMMRFVEEAFDEMDKELNTRGVDSIGKRSRGIDASNGAALVEEFAAHAHESAAAAAGTTITIMIVNMGVTSSHASIICWTPPVAPNAIDAAGLDATFEVMKEASHALLGVRSYTNLLFGHFATKLFEQHGITIHKGMHDGRRLSDAIQRLCKLLSSKTEAEVIVEKLVDHNTNAILKLSRSELRAVCQSPFQQLRQLLEPIVRSTEIDRIELTGTGNNMPMMKDVLLEVLECTTQSRKPLLETSHINTSIAMGAGVLGRALAPFAHALRTTHDTTRTSLSTLPWGRTHLLRSDAADVVAMHDGEDDVYDGGGSGAHKPADEGELACEERMGVDGASGSRAHESSGRLRPRKQINYDEDRNRSCSDTSSQPPGHAPCTQRRVNESRSASDSAYAPSENVSSTTDSGTRSDGSASTISHLTEDEVIEQNTLWADKADRRTIKGKAVYLPTCITEDDAQLAIRELRAHISNETKCGDARLQHFLTLLFKKLHNNSKWLQAAPESSVYSFAADPTDGRVVHVQRRIARRFGFLAPSVARNFTFYSWPESEHRVLNELARGGWLYEATKADRELIYGKNDSLDELLDMWRAMLHATAAKTQRTYELPDDAILDDYELGRAASAGAMREPLAILARDWDTLHKNKVLSMRLGINVLPGGRQAREGGNSKNTTTADVNGPRHFGLEDADTGELLDKDEKLDSYRRVHMHDSKVDPIRRPVARELKANRSERTEAYRRAAIDANTFSALVESILVGRSQAEMIPPFFALDPPWKQGDARRWMTSESACFGAGSPPERWAAPKYFTYETYPKNFVQAVEKAEPLPEWPIFPTGDDDVYDGDEVCKPFPTEADLAGATGGSFGSLLKAFEAAVNAGEMKHLSPDDQCMVKIALQLAATPGHLDVNCYGSGTKQCSRAQIVSIAKPSTITPYFDGSFLLEGQPSTRDATGKRVIDKSRMSEGVGSSFELLKQWEAGTRFLPAFPAGRVSGTPGNDTHFVIGVGQDGFRVRDVQYQTASFGGLAHRLGKANPDAFEPLATLTQKAASLSSDQEAWLSFGRPFDADENTARILTYLFGKYLVERQHEEPNMWEKGQLVCLRPGRTKEGEADDEDDEDEHGEEDDEDDEVQRGGTLLTSEKASDTDLRSLAELQATAKYMATLRLFLLAQPTTALVVNQRDILQYTYFFWSSRADPLYTMYTSKLEGLWQGSVAPVAIVTAFAAIHHLPDMKEHVFDHIDWENRKFKDTDMGRALGQLDEDVEPWFRLVTPLMINEPPFIEQRKERFELRPNERGHRAEEHLEKLRAFAERAHKITVKTKSYAEIHDCLVRQVPKGSKSFAPLRAVLIVREIGHALKGVVGDGDGLDVEGMPSANEHRNAMHLKVTLDGTRATLRSHLERVDAHLTDLHTTYKAHLPMHVAKRVAELHDVHTLLPDKEPVSCETMRELRDLHAVLVQQAKISSKCFGRQAIVHGGVTEGSIHSLDYVYRGARQTMSLRLNTTEVAQVRVVLTTVYKDLEKKLRDATPLVHAMLRRDDKKAKRRKAAERRAAKKARA